MKIISLGWGWQSFTKGYNMEVVPEKKYTYTNMKGWTYQCGGCGQWIIAPPEGIIFSDHQCPTVIEGKWRDAPAGLLETGEVEKMDAKDVMELWKKYGLSMTGAEGIMRSEEGLFIYTVEEAEDYYRLVELCHDAVASFYEENPELRGLGYFKALKLANPDLDGRMLEWAKEHKRKLEELKKNRKEAEERMRLIVKE